MMVMMMIMMRERDRQIESKVLESTYPVVFSCTVSTHWVSFLHRILYPTLFISVIAETFPILLNTHHKHYFNGCVRFLFSIAFCSSSSSSSS